MLFYSYIIRTFDDPLEYLDTNFFYKFQFKFSIRFEKFIEIQTISKVRGFRVHNLIWFSLT